MSLTEKPLLPSKVVLKLFLLSPLVGGKVGSKYRIVLDQSADKQHMDYH